MIPIAVSDGVSATTWEQAVETAAELLVGLGVATADYPAACVDIVRQQGPYIVLAPGLALAHARPESGGRELGVGCVRLEQPVTFGHPKNDPVDLVISFCSPDDREHITVITALGKGLSNGLAQDLRAAGSAPELETLLKAALA